MPHLRIPSATLKVRQSLKLASLVLVWLFLVYGLLSSRSLAPLVLVIRCQAAEYPLHWMQRTLFDRHKRALGQEPIPLNY
ncbi:hypothetical protein M405DRAFT_827148 [Rhizopogon salebrosus TDB-379]|nr:hypothetical protein M405DRAFT_827148 [Rhizopogon salebrosus TDB-379]